MKLRKGFVSNSSSSSFVCGVCGESDTLYSEEPSLCCVNCENGHSFHTGCVSSADDFIVKCPKCGNKLDELYCCDSYIEPESVNIEVEDCLFIKADKCPFCQLNLLTKQDELEYLKKISGIDANKEIKAKFKNYKEFKNFLKGSK